MGVANRKRKRQRKTNGGYRIVRKKTKKNPTLDAPLAVRQLWDKNKTLRMNYENIGLSYDPSTQIKNIQKEMVEKEKVGGLNRDEEGNIVIEDDKEGKEELKKLLNVPEAAPPKAPKLGKRERWYWKALHDKYKEDYKAMARDFKLNYNQYTAKVCQKKTQLYLSEYKERLINESPKVVLGSRAKNKKKQINKDQE